MLNVESTIVSQYSESATIVQIVKDMDAWIDPSADIQAFYDYVFNVETAQGFGLDYWGKIVGIGRELKITLSENNLGFKEANAKATFGEGTFVPSSTQTSVYSLPDDAYRKLIYVKALANISATNASALNQLLQNLFADRGRAYVNDLGGMEMRYTFEFDLTPVELAIVKNSGAIPRPAGVAVKMINIAPTATFGFAGTGSATFGEGSFFSSGALSAIN